MARKGVDLAPFPAYRPRELPPIDEETRLAKYHRGVMGATGDSHYELYLKDIANRVFVIVGREVA